MEQQNENLFYISSSISDNLPAMVRNELGKMLAQKLEEIVVSSSKKII